MVAVPPPQKKKLPQTLYGREAGGNGREESARLYDGSLLSSAKHLMEHLYLACSAERLQVLQGMDVIRPKVSPVPSLLHVRHLSMHALYSNLSSAKIGKTYTWVKFHLFQWNCGFSAVQRNTNHGKVKLVLKQLPEIHLALYEKNYCWGRWALLSFCSLYMD